ncbi:MAG TPA: HAMP domain-containing sensor histidine kinase [Acidimicrobiales bacterium]|nr:HAMP domain-containing sensor histidine kinase [Acidimicrobiales bacterium]
MTFRSRVITATVAAAAIAVILACFASFFTTRDSLIHSVDESLSTQATAEGRTGSMIHIGALLVLPNGQTIGTLTGVPIDATIISIAKGKSPEVYRTVAIGTHNYRELIVPIAANSVEICANGSPCVVKTTSAGLFITDIDGQVNELRGLIRTLMFVAIGGLLLAFALGLFLARTALRPLEQVTNEIEGVAETNDMGYRLTEGDEDELGRLRRVFNRLLSTVESSQVLQRQLVLDASHELRTPLTSLRTNAQVLSRAQELDPDDLRQLTDDMVTQVDELAALVTDLGELSRGERSEGVVETLRLEECIDECVETARTHARIKEIMIDVNVKNSNVLGRRDRLERAISNLLTNAIKFTPHGGRIVVKSREGTISVSDSGTGIDEADLPFIFDRFWRSASARALPGSGLGLSIVAQVVAELGGSVAVDRDPELGGARFTITLPIAEPST